MAIRLRIRGDINTVKRELSNRGIPTYSPVNPEPVTTVVDVPERPLGYDIHDIVARWFAEAPDKPPFPDGTLLHYSDVVERA